MIDDYQKVRDPTITISSSKTSITARLDALDRNTGLSPSGSPDLEEAPLCPPKAGDQGTDPFSGANILAYERALAVFRATHREPYGVECQGYPIPKEIDDICVAVTDARYFDYVEQSVGRFVWDAWHVVADHLLVRSYVLACLRQGKDPLRILRMAQVDKPISFLHTMARRGGVLVFRPHGDRPLTIVRRPWADDLPDWELDPGVFASANSLYQMAELLDVPWPQDWDPVGLVEHLRETLVAKKRLRKSED